MPISIRAHFEHHKRFYIAAALGILIWTLTRMLGLPVHVAVAGDAFFLVYLLSMLGMAHRATPSEMRARAAVKDEGIVLIVLITLAAIGLSLGSSFVVGMTAQVSDVQVLSTAMRRVTLLHGVVSFFYNTVLLALAVNVAIK